MERHSLSLKIAEIVTSKAEKLTPEELQAFVVDFLTTYLSVV
jgi:hypothetical protein